MKKVHDQVLFEIRFNICIDDQNFVYKKLGYNWFIYKS